MFSPLLTHFWSLAVEEQFYIVWPLILFLVPASRLRAVLLAFVAAGPFMRLAELGLFATPVAGLLHSESDLVVYVLPFSHIDAFALGGYLALFGRAPGRRAFLVYATALVACGMLTEWHATGRTGLSLGFPPFMQGSLKQVWGYSAANLLFGWTLLLIRERRFMPAVMESGALRYLGRISYGLYVYHFAMIWLASQALRAPLPGSPRLWHALSIIGAFGSTVLVSACSYRWLESPCLRLKDLYFSRRGTVMPIEDTLRPVASRGGPLVGT